MKFISSPGRAARAGTSAGREAGGRAVGTPRFLRGKDSVANPVADTTANKVARFEVAAPGDRHEREADRVAARFDPATTIANEAAPAPPMPSTPDRPARVAAVAASSGQPLDAATRDRMENHLGTDLSRVRVHTGARAAALNRDLGARAFTQGQDIFFGAGQAPGENALTAHELTHVAQQSGGLEKSGYAPAGSISARFGEAPIQCSFIGSFPVAGNGGFEIDMETREGALVAPPATPGASGMDGYIRFVPMPGAPNSNDINMIQIARVTDAGGADIDPGSMGAPQAPRGGLGAPGVRTQADPVNGIEGGFFTDVDHQIGAANTPRGAAMPPEYDYQPAAPGTRGVVGDTAQPPAYGGGIGGNPGHTRGFKRSDDAADIRSAVLYDTPGVASAAVNYDFSFESVARGEDTQFTYGAVAWGFGVHAGHVVGEHISVRAGQSATFDAALERHRDYYVHEPVTFYFGFDKAVLGAAEIAKIDAFLPYLARNPDVMLSLEGYADIVGGAGKYNLDLSMNRVGAVEAALLGKGIAGGRIDGISIGHGASTTATPDAGGGDQGGSAAVGADQSREANRWANRRVVVTFSHPAAAPAPGP